jgi:hypothetical protein
LSISSMNTMPLFSALSGVYRAGFKHI